MSGLEIVYAVHKFEAENVDEISINVGEQVIVLEKDEGYNDGWWQGRNIRGEIGLFPITYTVKHPPSSLLENKIDSLETAISNMKTNGPIQKKASVSSISSKNIQSIVSQSLNHVELSQKLVEEWTSDQVATWLMDIGFDKELADNFKDQEISGDILLELTLDSLKELQVSTFGKRFKIHNAINALRQENKKQKYTNQHRHKKANNNIEARVASPFPDLNISRNNHNALASYYNLNKQAYPEDDLVSDYSTIIRNSQIKNTPKAPSINEKPTQLVSRPSIPLDMDLIASSPRLSTLVEHSTSSDLLYERQQQQQQEQQQLRTQFFKQQQQYHHRPVSHQIAPNPTTTSLSSEWKRNTMNNMKTTQEIPLQDGNGRISTSARYSFMKNSLSTNKLQSVIPNSQMMRRSEDVPNVTNDISAAPDMEGWLYKQGDKYKTWNKRWFVLKANNLFYFKSPTAVRMKGIINLKGYRIEVDETIHAGKYCFMAHHPKERTFYFYTDFEKSMKEWLKALMKATIARDYGTPVMSSSTIPTVSLDVARRMRPRPPSTIFQQQPLRSSTPMTSSNLNQHFSLMSLDERAQPIIPYQDSRAPSAMSIRQQPLEPKRDNSSDYSVTSQNNNRLKDSGFNSAHGGHAHTETSSSHSSSGRQSISINSIRPSIQQPLNDNSTTIYFPDEEDEDLIDPEHMSVIESNRHYREGEQTRKQPLNTKQQSYINWINSHIQNKISLLSDLSTGEALLEFLENISNKEIMRPVAMPTQSENAQRMDRVITAFKFMSLEGVELDGSCTIRDVMNGIETKMMYMLDAVEYWIKANTAQVSSKKMASGGTFGEDDQCKLRELEQQQQ